MAPQLDLQILRGSPSPRFNPVDNLHAAHMQPMTPEQHRMMAAAMQHQAMEHQHQQQQFEHKQIAHMNAMKFHKPTPDSLAQMAQSYSKGQNVTLTPEQIAQVMHYCDMMGTHIGPNMMPGNQNALSQGWQGGQQPEMIMNPVPDPNASMPPPVDCRHAAQQFEHQQIAHMTAMKFNKPTPDISKGRFNGTLTPEQIAQVMQYCEKMGTSIGPNMMPGNLNVLPQARDSHNHQLPNF